MMESERIQKLGSIFVSSLDDDGSYLYNVMLPGRITQIEEDEEG